VVSGDVMIDGGSPGMRPLILLRPWRGIAAAGACWERVASIGGWADARTGFRTCQTGAKA
jgi:hypothetical protein